MASLFIAAQNHTQLKTYDTIRMTDNILSVDRVISVWRPLGLNGRCAFPETRALNLDWQTKTDWGTSPLSRCEKWACNRLHLPGREDEVLGVDFFPLWNSYMQGVWWHFRRAESAGGAMMSLSTCQRRQPATTTRWSEGLWSPTWLLTDVSGLRQARYLCDKQNNTVTQAKAPQHINLISPTLWPSSLPVFSQAQKDSDSVAAGKRAVWGY